MSRTAIFANTFNDLIAKASQEAEQQKIKINKQLEDARSQAQRAQDQIKEFETQLANIDDELAIGLVAAARNAGIKIDLKRANQAVSSNQTSPKPTRKTPSDTTREKAAVVALLTKKKGQWIPSTEIKDITGVERPVSILLKNAEGIESQGKGRGVQYRIP